MIAICFIACSAGPADHFATFAEELRASGHKVALHAAGPALTKFTERKVADVTPFKIEGDEMRLAIEIAKVCSAYSVVVTDIHDRFDIPLQRALAEHAPKTRRFAYYDNPDPYVPGGYSEVAAEVIGLAQGVIFANAHYEKEPVFRKPDDKEEISLEGKLRVGLGYYPTQAAYKLKEAKKSEQPRVRKALFEKHSLQDKGQKIVTYFGGNNEEYFNNALPAFLEILKEASRREDLSGFIFLFQQHPGARTKNRDGERILAFSKEHKLGIIFSSLTYDQAVMVTDIPCYYQTSSAPQFVLMDLPALQVAHKINRDNLVRRELCATATDEKALLQHLHAKPVQVEKERLIATLGIRDNWYATLLTIF